MLLAALVLEANRAVSTDRLVEALWGDEAPTKPLTSLRACISNVRKVLPPAGDGEPALVTEPGGYRLRVDDDALDVARFDRSVDEARTARAGGQIAAAADLLDRAIELVRGEPLADLAYDEFAQREIGRLSEAVLSAQAMRAEVAIELGDAEAWLGRISDLVAANPLHERLRASHMLALYQVGRQADALRSYQDHRDSMVDELGLEPGAELRELEGRILAQDASLVADPASTAPPRPADRSDDPGPADDPGRADDPDDGRPGPERHDRAIVGREVELDRLRTLAAAPPGVAVLVGESGSGKSTVGNALLQELDGQGWRTARGVCLDDDGVPPLWPWYQALRDLGLAGPTERTVEDAANRFDLFDGLATALLDAAATGPVAVFLDDLQWADGDTVKLLDHVARRARGQRLLLIGAARVAPVLPSGLSATWVELGNLGRDDIAELIEAKTGQPPAPGVTEELWRRTGGNAYFVTELIDVARRMASEVGPDIEIPGHVRDLVLQRIAGLAPRTVELLEVAALTVDGFRADIVAAVVGDSTEAVLGDLEPAVDRGLIAPDPTGVGRHRFDHAITRETIEGRIDPTRQARLHAAHGRAIEVAAGPDAEREASLLSRHYGLGAQAGSAVEAIRWARVAADAAAGMWSHRDAITHLRRALAAEAHLAEPDPRIHCELQLALGRSSRVIGDIPAAEEALLAAYRQADALGDAELVARAALALSDGLGAGHWRWYWNPGSVGTAALERALDVLPAEDSPLRAQVLAQFGADGVEAIDPDRRQAMLEDAVAMAERLGDPLLTVKLQHYRRSAVGWSWGPSRALEHDREQLRVCQEHGLDGQELRFRGAILVDLITLGDLAEARREFDHVRSMARLRGSTTWLHYTTVWELFFAQLAGDWDEAERLEAEAIDPVTGRGPELAETIATIGQLTTYHRGGYDEAAAYMQLGYDMSGRRLLGRSALNSLVLAGRREEAEALLASIDPTLPDTDQIGGRLGIALATEAVVLLGRHEHLDALIASLEPLADELAMGAAGLGGVVFIGPIRYFLALATTAAGRFDEAAEHIERARRLLKDLEAPSHALRLDYAEARLVAAHRGPEAAEALFAQLAAAAERAGMMGLATLARAGV